MTFRQGDTVYAIQPLTDQYQHGHGERVTAGEVGRIVGWQGLELAVVDFGNDLVVSVPMTGLRPSRSPKGTTYNDLNRARK